MKKRQNHDTKWPERNETHHIIELKIFTTDIYGVKITRHINKKITITKIDDM